MGLRGWKLYQNRRRGIGRSGAGRFGAVGMLAVLMLLGWAPPGMLFAQDKAPIMAQSSEARPVAENIPAPGGSIRRGAESVEASSLEDVMLEKGLISVDDWIRIKAEEERRASERSVVAEFTGSARWFERINHYGYGMMRYNVESNGNLRSYHDASVGGKNNGAQPGFFYRRIRWVVTGQVSDHVAFFLQPDLASNISGNTHAVSLRDAFGDYYFDKGKEYRIRVGLQRVPCSWDNWQASRQRMAIDRADATNSCAPSERDMGVAFMWSPKIAQQRFKQMLDYMYGPGDYGVFNITVDNAQGLNNVERNEDKRVGIRLAWPFELPGGRLMEVGMNANRGMFNVNYGTAATGNTLFSLNESRSTSARNIVDERLNFFIYYPPQPWGFIAEYVVGRGPKRGSDGIVRESALRGGYVQGHYQWKYSDTGLANIYARYQEYYGGLKFQTGAPDDRMHELEMGVAWQPDPQWEITVAYTFTQRLNVFNTANNIGACTAVTNCTPGQQLDTYGNLLRFQVIWFWN